MIELMVIDAIEYSSSAPPRLLYVAAFAVLGTLAAIVIHR